MLSPMELSREAVRDCTACPLHRGCRAPVPGEGSFGAEIALIGEAPGWKEDSEGRPFVGPAGSILDGLLHQIGLDRNDIYILNVLNCKPPNNRDPKTTELEACRVHLINQLSYLPNLKTIVAMGRYASLYLCPNIKPKDLRGTARWIDGRVNLFLFHPAVALHNPQSMPELERGFELLRTLL